MNKQKIMSMLNELQQLESIINMIPHAESRRSGLTIVSNLYANINTYYKSLGQPIVLVDMDEVLADLIGAWLSLYNKDYDDNITLSHLKDWNTALFVKDECGKKVYDYFKTPGLFRYLEVRPYAKEFIRNLLKNDVTVLIVSDSPSGHSHCEYTTNNQFVGNPADDKRRWLAEHFPEIDQSNIIFTSKKWFIHGDVIVDDKPDTFIKFQEKGRNAILMSQPYNEFIQTPHKATNLKEAEEKVYKMIGMKQRV